ncbi:MAG: PadR family transcriptional regulator, partial [Candidatus Bathyarchaeia archaeon]
RSFIRNFSNVIILLELRRRALGGHDIISCIQNKFQVTLSPSTVYSSLYSLEKNGFVKGRYLCRKKVYAITDKGKKMADKFLNMKDIFLETVMKLFDEE